MPQALWVVESPSTQEHVQRLRRALEDADDTRVAKELGRDVRLHVAASAEHLDQHVGTRHRYSGLEVLHTTKASTGTSRPSSSNSAIRATNASIAVMDAVSSLNRDSVTGLSSKRPVEMTRPSHSGTRAGRSASCRRG